MTRITRGNAVLAALALVAVASMATACNKAWDELDGHVTFVERNDDGVLELYMAEASGRGKVLLYSHDDPKNANVMQPRWSADGSKITFSVMKNGAWTAMQIDPGTHQVTPASTPSDVVSRASRAEDIKVERGSVYIDKGGKKVQVYRFRGAFDSKLSRGATEASWSPDRQHVIFQTCHVIGGCKVYAARADGSQKFYLTGGQMPDWTNAYHPADDHGAGHGDGHGEDAPAKPAEGAH